MVINLGTAALAVLRGNYSSRPAAGSQLRSSVAVQAQVWAIMPYARSRSWVNSRFLFAFCCHPEHNPGGAGSALMPLVPCRDCFRLGAEQGDTSVSVFLFHGKPGSGPGPHRHP
jgi:hypothetical protein